MTLALCPVTLREARTFVTAHHRHHEAPQGGLFAVGCSDGAEIVGVAIIGKPVARMADDDYTAEVTRLCTLGGRDVCSMLYGASWRACRALGYRRLITYTLAEEGGTSLRAAGWRLIGEAGGGSWSRKDRPRVDTHPTQTKLRWERGSSRVPEDLPACKLNTLAVAGSSAVVQSSEAPRPCREAAPLPERRRE